MRKYELWLDETGGFSPEEQIEGSGKDKVYSIIGGVLMPGGCISNEEAMELVGNEIGHATQLERTQVKEDLIPALVSLKNKGGEFVFFENCQRMTEFSQTELYLEMMVDGILQLLSFLSSFDQEFQLEIMIATRYVPSDRDLIMIPAEKYYVKLEESLRQKLRYGYMNLDDDVKINLMFSSARKEPKLMLADYVCGARRGFLREKDRRYQEEEKKILGKLFDENYCFACYEYALMGRVKSKLFDNQLADAILLLCDDKSIVKDLPESYMKQYGEQLREKIKWMIFRKMEQLGKQEIYCQMEELLSDVSMSIRMECEYEWGETLLTNFKKDFMEKLKQYEQYDEKLELEVSLCYGYLYLKEGDLLSLQKELMIAEKLFSQLPQCLDFVEYRLQIWMLRQAYCLKSFDFEGACIWENKLVDYMESLKDLLYITGIWTDEASVPNELQEEMTSLYLMRIYYNWRLTSGDTGKWAEQLQKASDQLEKSQMEFIRIFPRACYYYQIKEEHHTRALIWLFRFAGISINAEQVSDWSKLRKKAAVFCQVLIEMDGRQKIELIREYFILIVSLKKQEIREKLSYTPSFILYEAAHKSGLFDVLVKQKEGQPILKTVLPTQNLPRYKHLVRSVLKDFQDRIYHPEEQVWWLLASYLELCNGSSRTQIDRYYDRALKICGDSSEYAVMNLSALAIWTDKIGNAMIRNQEKTKQLWNKFQQVYRKTMKKGCLPEKMKEYVQLLFRRQGINPDWNESEAGSETGRQLMSIAERFLALASF